MPTVQANCHEWTQRICRIPLCSMAFACQCIQRSLRETSRKQLTCFLWLCHAFRATCSKHTVHVGSHSHSGTRVFTGWHRADSYFVNYTEEIDEAALDSTEVHRLRGPLKTTISLQPNLSFAQSDMEGIVGSMWDHASWVKSSRKARSKTLKCSLWTEPRVEGP